MVSEWAGYRGPCRDTVGRMAHFRGFSGLAGAGGPIGALSRVMGQLDMVVTGRAGIAARASQAS